MLIHGFGNKNPNWKGGRITSRGYIYIHKPDHPFCSITGYIAEHRLVMEQKINRYLKNNEDVHHINGVKNDNRKENLIVLLKSKHTALEMIGNQHSKGNVPWNKGKKLPQYAGKNNPNYKHG